MKAGKLVLAIMVLSAPVLLSAQTGDSPSMRVNDYLRSGSGLGLGLNSFGFLDPSRMTFQHSYSMSYLTSGGQGVMRGLFMESIGYRLSNPLSLTLNLGFMHQPYSSYGPDGITQGANFVGGAALNWQPSKNMFLRFEVGRYPAGSQMGYYPLWSPMPYGPITQPQTPSNQATNTPRE